MTELNLTVSPLHQESVAKVVEKLTALKMSCVVTSDNTSTNIQIWSSHTLTQDVVLSLGTYIGHVQMLSLVNGYHEEVQSIVNP